DLAFDQARAADQGHGFVLAHELPCGGLGGGGVALIVQGLVFDLAAVDAAVCIDLLEVGGGCLRGLREGGRAALGVHRADHDRLVSCAAGAIGTPASG